VRKYTFVGLHMLHSDESIPWIDASPLTEHPTLQEELASCPFQRTKKNQLEGMKQWPTRKLTGHESPRCEQLLLCRQILRRLLQSSKLLAGHDKPLSVQRIVLGVNDELEQLVFVALWKKQSQKKRTCS
jgi:hypothetical protein